MKKTKRKPCFFKGDIIELVSIRNSSYAGSIFLCLEDLWANENQERGRAMYLRDSFQIHKVGHITGLWAKNKNDFKLIKGERK
jgi:hypothetical protein